MKLSDDFQEHRSVNMTLINMTLLMSVIVIAILGLVFWTNLPSKAAKSSKKTESETEGANGEISDAQQDALDSQKSVSELISGSTLTSNDLDIWNMTSYDTDLHKDALQKTESDEGGDGIVTSKADYAKTAQGLLDEYESSTEINDNKTPLSDKTQNGEEIQKINIEGEPHTESEEETETEKEADVENDGKHTKVIHANGDEEWVEIDSDITTNDYDMTKLVYQKPMMKYYVDGKVASYFGMDISKDQGVVDFVKFKKAGGDFVMLKLGGRGYSSGKIVIDEMFKEFAKNASDAGVKVGVYFFSQATTKEEAKEEAKTVIDTLKGYSIKYPVVFRMETVGGDMTRIDDLNSDDRTEIAKTFLDQIKSAGYIPMLYGDKEWLLTKYNLKDLQDYEIWYTSNEDIPDYPYKFGMWQYTNQGAIDGVSGDIKLDISFKDYAHM